MTTYADFEAFADEIGERRRRAERLTPSVRSTLESGAQHDAPPADALAADAHATSDLLTDALGDLGLAEEELRVQNEALFAAHIELAQEHQAFRDLFEHAPVAYLVTTTRGVLTRVNQAATRLVARPANLIVGKPLSVYVAPADRAAFRAALARSAASDRPETWRVRLAPRGCGELECRVHTRVVRPVSLVGAGPAGEPLGHWVITEEPWDAADDLV